MRKSFVVLAVAFLAAISVEAKAGSHVPGLRVLSMDASGLLLEYRLGALSLQPVTTPDGQMTRVQIAGFGMLSDDGKPALPVAGVWVALPPTGSFTLRVVEDEVESMSDVDVVPSDRVLPARQGDSLGEQAREYQRDARAYDAQDPYPGAPAVLEGESWLRFQRVAALRIHPVRYAAVRRALLVSRRLVLRVEFGTRDQRSTRVLTSAGLEAAPAMDGRFEQIYAGAVINYEQGRAFRARPRRSDAQTLDTLSLGSGNPEWKVQIDSTGVWRVSFEQLSAQGWPAGVPIGAVSAYLRDTTVNLSPTPWTTTEIPIDVVDLNNDSIFNSGDFVVLAVQTWAERTSPTWDERRHGDAEVVWLWYKSAGTGLRMTTRPGWLEATNPSVPTSFESARRYELTLQYDSVPSDVTQIDQFLWTDGVSDYQPIDLQADLLDLDVAGMSITVRAEWVGRRSIQHSVSASWVNGSMVETPLWTNESFSGKGAFTRSQTFPASAASPGVNRFRIRGSSPQIPFGSGASLNWFDVAYPRAYVARNNRLEFTSGGASDTAEYRVDGYVSATRPVVYAYDVTNWGAAVRLTVAPDQVVDQGGAWRVLLRDIVPAATTRRYSVATEIRAVPDEAIIQEIRSTLFLTPAQDAEFVIIAHDDFAAAMEPLAALRRSQSVGTLLARSQDVYDEFDGGRKSHFAIRRFLRYALANWSTRYVLLVGDASEDPRNLLGSAGPDWVPTPVIPGPVAISDGFSSVHEVVPSDNWYVFGLAGPPGPGEDLLVDMLIGRWTSGSASETEALVDKTIANETGGTGEQWRARAVLVADDDYSTASGPGDYCRRSYEEVFEDISRNVDLIIRQEGGYSNYDVRPFYLSSYLSGLPMVAGCSDSTRANWSGTQQYTRNAVSPQLFQILGEGAGFVNFQGHGNPSVLTHEDLYLSRGFEQDIDQIFNTGKPWVFTGFSSHLNSYARVQEGNSSIGDGLCERMVNVAQRGAIASFASTAYEVLPSGAGNHLNEHVYRAFFADPPPGDTTGPGQLRLSLGEATALGVARMVAGTSSGPERGAAQTYVLLGDPLVSLWLSRTVDVPDPPTVLAPTLAPGRPNPSHGITRFAFSLLSRVGRARLGLYDVSGRLVRVLVDKALAPGTHEALWDGTIDGGRPASSGVYFCRLELDGPAGRQTLSRRVVHLR